MGGKTSTSSSSTSPPPQVLQSYQDLVNRATGVANTPYQQYQGPMLYGSTQDQLQAYEQLSNLYGTAQPYINQAAGYAQNAATPTSVNAQTLQPFQNPFATAGAGAATAAGQGIANYGTQAAGGIAGLANNIATQGPQLQQFSSAAIDQYMNPYTQDVIDRTMANINRQNALQQNDLVSRGIMGGNAFGGDRLGVASAELARNQDMSRDQIIANLLSSGYGQALSQFNTGNQQALAGQQTALQGLGAAGQLGVGAQSTGGQLGLAGQQLGATGYQQGIQDFLNQQGLNNQSSLAAGQLYSSLGSQALQSQLAAGNAQLTSGQLQQQQAQAELNVPYQQWLQQQAYPFQTTQWLGNLILGTGAQSGQSTTQTSPGPNVGSQILGLGATALGAFMASDERTKENVEAVGKTFDGQPIYRFNYKGDPRTQVGLIAQDVERKHPDAVAEHGGYKYVDYDRATEGAANKGHFAGGGGVMSPVGLSSNAPGLFEQIQGMGGPVTVRGYVPDAKIEAGKPLTPAKIETPKDGSGGTQGLASSFSSGRDLGKAFSNRFGNSSDFSDGSFYGPSSVGGAPLSGFELPVASSFGGVGAAPYADGGSVPEPTFDERFAGEGKSSLWEHFVAGAKDWGENARRIATGEVGVGNPPAFARHRELWDRDRRNRYADGGAPSGPLGLDGPQRQNPGDQGGLAPPLSLGPPPGSAGPNQGPLAPPPTLANPAPPLQGLAPPLMQGPGMPPQSPGGMVPPRPPGLSMPAAGPSGPPSMPPPPMGGVGNVPMPQFSPPPASADPRAQQLTEMVKEFTVALRPVAGQGKAPAGNGLMNLRRPGGFAFGGTPGGDLADYSDDGDADTLPENAAYTAGSGDPMAAYRTRIGRIESDGSGGYAAEGVETGNGDRAYGKYQIMGNNITPWGREALGRDVTREEFMDPEKGPQIQDAIFNHRFGQYVAKYGPEGAARAWFAGPGGMNDPNRKDALGTTVAQYSRKFTGAGPSGATGVENRDTRALPPGVAERAERAIEMGRPDIGQAIMAAGLAMMAGTSPFAGVNIGQGGIIGLQNYAQQKKELREQYSADLQAKRLQEAAQHARDTLAETTRHNTLTDLRARESAASLEQYRQDMAKHQRALELIPKVIGKDKWGAEIYAIPDGKGGFNRIDPETGRVVPGETPGPTSSAAPSATPSSAPGQPPKITADAGIPSRSDNATQQPQQPIRLASAVLPDNFLPVGTDREPKTSPNMLLPGEKAAEEGAPVKGLNPGVLENPDYKDVAEQIKAISEGRAPYPSERMQQSPIGRRVREGLSKYDPSFDATNFKSRQNLRNSFLGGGKDATTIRSLNQLMQHVEEHERAIDKLAEFRGTGIPFVASAKQHNEMLSAYYERHWDEKVRNRYKAALADYEKTGAAVATELGKIAQGTGTLAVDTRREWNKGLDAMESPVSQMAAVISSMNLLKGSIDSIGKKWNDGAGPASQRDPMSWMSKEARKAYEELYQADPVKRFEAIRKRAKEAETGAPGAAPAETATPAAPVAAQRAAERQKAIEWLKANPDHPKAEEIKKRLGIP